jgi:type I restriction enzyme S subunit
VDFLRTLPIPVPPVDEQFDIASRLTDIHNRLDALGAHLESAEELLDDLRASVLVDACSGKLTFDLSGGRDSESGWPSGWRAATLGELAARVTSGSRGWAKYYAEMGPVFIRAQNLRDDRLSVEGIAHVDPPDGAEAKRTRVEVADLLITITGANVTKTGWVEGEIGEAYVNQHVALVRCRDTSLAPFLYLWLLSPAHGRATLKRDAYGAGKPGLNLGNVKSVPVVVPPAEEAQAIARRAFQLLAFVETASADVSERQERLHDLREATANSAFRGELGRSGDALTSTA